MGLPCLQLASCGVALPKCNLQPGLTQLDTSNMPQACKAHPCREAMRIAGPSDVTCFLCAALGLMQTSARPTNLFQNGGQGPAALSAPREGHDAEGAHVVAPTHDAEEG